MVINMKEETLNALCDLTRRASLSLYNTLRYVYAVADSEFYNINIKDVFKLALSDISNPDTAANLGISAEDKRLPELNFPEFKKLDGLICYSFALRLAFLKREVHELKDAELMGLFELIVSKGAENPDNILDGDFKSLLKFAKSRDPEPVFNGEWFRRWVYTRGNGLAAINNKNMFLLGCTDALMPLYYSMLFDMWVEIIKPPPPA